jgi:hypothetical protein
LLGVADATALGEVGEKLLEGEVGTPGERFARPTGGLGAPHQLNMLLPDVGPLQPVEHTAKRPQAVTIIQDNRDIEVRMA